jgi:hypothetical protein
MTIQKRPRQAKRKSSLKLFCPQKSLYKMILFPRQDQNKPMTRYSNLKLDLKSDQAAIDGLMALAHSDEYKDYWRTCLIYNNETRALALKILHNGKTTLGA